MGTENVVASKELREQVVGDVLMYTMQSARDDVARREQDLRLVEQKALGLLSAVSVIAALAALFNDAWSPVDAVKWIWVISIVFAAIAMIFCVLVIWLGHAIDSPNRVEIREAATSLLDLCMQDGSNVSIDELSSGLNDIASTYGRACDTMDKVLKKRVRLLRFQQGAVVMSVGSFLMGLLIWGVL